MEVLGSLSGRKMKYWTGPMRPFTLLSSCSSSEFKAPLIKEYFLEFRRYQHHSVPQWRGKERPEDAALSCSGICRVSHSTQSIMV